jgi:hypothetical protein
VGPRAVLDAVVKRKIPSPRRESNPRTPIVQPAAQRYTDRAIMAPKEEIVISLNNVEEYVCCNEGFVQKVEYLTDIFEDI